MLKSQVIATEVVVDIHHILVPQEDSLAHTEAVVVHMVVVEDKAVRKDCTQWAEVVELRSHTGFHTRGMASVGWDTALADKESNRAPPVVHRDLEAPSQPLPQVVRQGWHRARPWGPAAELREQMEERRPSQEPGPH